MKDTIYQSHAPELIKNISPEDVINHCVNLFMREAAINMGSEFNEPALEKIIEVVKSDFKYLPLCYIYSAFVSGSMGKYGPGRLVPRTVASWLNEISSEYNRKIARETVKYSDLSDAVDFREFPAGAAIVKKIDWYKMGLIDGRIWDQINLRELTEAVRKNRNITFEQFSLEQGIEI